jgi:hypothetical protein
MPRFSIYSGPLLVGWSELETGDPPMGVAEGKFIPTADYAKIQARVVDSSQSGKGDLQLIVRREGEELQAQGGVHITDYSAELGADGLQVSVLGIVRPPYESLFPEHVAAYARAFRNGG